MKDIFEKITVKHKYILPVVGGMIAIFALTFILIFMTAGNDENEVKKDTDNVVDTDGSLEIDNSVSGGDDNIADNNDNSDNNVQDIQDNENVVRGEFTNVMGYNGYTLRDKSAVYPHITRYYAVEGEDAFLIAESWNFEDKEDDYIIDIDGDGITELVCNCTYGDGGQSVVVYKRDGYYTYKGEAGDFSTINYVNTGVIRPMKFYNSTENVVEILYHEDADGELLCTKQELTWDIIDGWTLYSDATEEKREHAYITVLENVLYYQTFPDGIDRGYDGVGTNKFSICDIDGDGRVYSIMTGNEYTWENPVDNWKYKMAYNGGLSCSLNNVS